MYRRIVLVAFIVLAAFSAIYALMDRRKVTTSSDKAYEAYLKGDDLLNRLYVQEGLQEFEKAVKLDPNFAMAYARMAGIYYDYDRKADYLLAREKALSRLDNVKDLERILIQLGFARTDGKADDVDRYAGELLKKYPDHFETQKFLSSRYWMKGNADSAIAANLRIIQIDPDYALAYNMLGYLFYDKGEFDKALEYINIYSEVAGDQANPHDSRGEILTYLGRYDEALEALQTADSIKPNLTFVVGHMGDVYAAKGMFRDAIGAYLKAKELSPGDRMTLDFDLDISAVYQYSDRPGEAIALLKEAVERMPEVVAPHARLGSLFASQGMMDDALVELGIVKGLLARNDSEKSPSDTAAAWVSPDQLYLEAYIAAARGDYDRAIDLSRKVMDQVKLQDRPYFAHVIGEFYLKSNRPEQAIEVIEAASKINANHPLCLLTLAEAQKAAGRQPEYRQTILRLADVLKDADEDVAAFQQLRAEAARLASQPL